MKKKRVRDKFLEELKKVPIVSVACQNCGVSRNTVYRWRNEDSEFLELMNLALNDGESSIHDLAESKLIGLINQSNLQAIRFWLTNRNAKYKKHEEILEPPQQESINPDEVIRALRLTDRDFEDDKRAETAERIRQYLKSL